MLKEKKNIYSQYIYIINSMRRKHNNVAQHKPMVQLFHKGNMEKILET